MRKRCRTLSGFIKEAWPILEPMTPYTHGWHIDFVARHLEAITRGEFLKLGLPNRLIINVPPGTMKSLEASVFWEAWEWGPAGLPGMRYLTTSYDDDNIARDCRKHRDLVDSDWYQRLWPDVKLVRRAESDFSNNHTGSRLGAPMGSLTGKRGDRVVIDDPHSTTMAESDKERAATLVLFRESIPLRLNSPKESAIVIIMQRLHQHDLTGAALALKLGYTHVMLPMEFEPERRCITPFGKDPRTKENELLFPARFPREVVDRDKIPLGSYGVAGQFQQRPSPRGGLLFKRAWFKIVRAAPAGIPRVRAYDLAATERDQKVQVLDAAYTCGLLMSRSFDGKFYIEHVWRDQLSGAQVKTQMRNTAEQDGLGTDIDLPQDPGSAGKVVSQDYISNLAGFNAYASVETGDKYSRAEPVSAQAEAGNFYVVEGPWNEAFFSELELFPAGAYKDQVDAMSRAFARLIRRKDGPVVLPVVEFVPVTHFGDRND